MAFTRQDAADYLGDEWGRYLVLAGLLATDAAGGVKSVIDRAFTAMGVARADLVSAALDDAQAVGVEAVLDKYAARRLHKALGDLVSISGGNPGASKQQQQAWEHLHTMLATYDAAANVYEATDDSNSWQAPGYATVDVYEPLPPGWVWP